MIWAEKLLRDILLPVLVKPGTKTGCSRYPRGQYWRFYEQDRLGDPDPSNYKTGFDGADDINEWFGRDKPDDWRQRDYMNIAKNLLEKVGELLDAEVQYIVCCDKKTQHKKIVIDMTTAVIYTNGSQECERMASLLASLDDVSEFWNTVSISILINLHF